MFVYSVCVCSCVFKSLGSLKGDFLLRECRAQGTQRPQTEQLVLQDWVCTERTRFVFAYPNPARSDAPLMTSSCRPGSGSCRPGTDTRLWLSCWRAPPWLFPRHPRCKPWRSVERTHNLRAMLEFDMQLEKHFHTMLKMTPYRLYLHKLLRLADRNCKTAQVIFIETWKAHIAFFKHFSYKHWGKSDAQFSIFYWFWAFRWSVTLISLAQTCTHMKMSGGYIQINANSSETKKGREISFKYLPCTCTQHPEIKYTKCTVTQHTNSFK